MGMSKLHNDPHQSGNVLFLILIAVALFAALSYAVTLTTRSSGGGSAENEKAHMIASQFGQYGSSLAAAITRLRLSGCADTDLNFAHPSLVHPTFWAGSHNPSAPANGNCDVFGSAGGAILIRYLHGLPTAPLMITSLVSVDLVGTPSSDIILYTSQPGTPLVRKACEAFNNGVGNSGNNAGGTIRTTSWTWARGVFSDSPGAVETIGEDGGGGLRGAYAGCAMGPTSHEGDNSIFFQVLLAR